MHRIVVDFADEESFSARNGMIFDLLYKPEFQFMGAVGVGPRPEGEGEIVGKLLGGNGLDFLSIAVAVGSRLVVDLPTEEGLALVLIKILVKNYKFVPRR